MSTSHGSLENKVLNAVWKLEASEQTEDITVNDIFVLIQKTTRQRAYTTIKTVMDRLVEKGMLVREKKGKKFSYKSTRTREEMASLAIKKLAKIYFNSDYKQLIEAVEKECHTSKVYA